MKKKFFISAIGVILALSITACGSSSEGSDTATIAEAEETETETVEEEVADETVFNGMTVVDNDECVIEISPLESGGIFGASLPVYLENKSSDKTYMFSLQSLAIDDLEISSVFAKEVAPGQKADEEIDIMDPSLGTAGINEYSDIELTFRVYDMGDWLAAPVALETVHIYLYGEENANSYVREPESTDNILIDDDNVTVIVTGYDPDSMWGYAVDFYLVNKTDTEVMFSEENASVNGHMIDPYWAASLSAGKSRYSSMSFSNGSLEDNEIVNVEEIEFTLKAIDDTDFMAQPYVEETVVLNP